MSKVYSLDQLTDSVELLERKTPRFIVILLCLLSLIFIALSIWAYVGKIDITSQGTALIEPQNPPIISQSRVGGNIDKILVKSGSYVEKGDILIKLNNEELMSKQKEVTNTVQYLEERREMLEQLRESIGAGTPSFSNNTNSKIVEEYEIYKKEYQSLINEKENSIEEMKENQLLDENSIELKTLKDERERVLNQYRNEHIISVNQRIQSMEDELFIKKQELDAVDKQSEELVIKANKDGIVQFSPEIEIGRLVDSEQQVASIIPKRDKKKASIILPAQEMKNIKKGDSVRYSFELQDTDQQTGKVTYISPTPFLREEDNQYVYKLEATIDVKNQAGLNRGMSSNVSVITGEKPAWKFILDKLNLI
ncbi:HlyD family secretion protein [Priestia filamentosa]|uniref:HlyD family secretion protein n=1 Tax=Priestia filamentosa TaxID=1402861 RepID=UPI003F191733